MTPLILPSLSFAAKKRPWVMLLPMVLLANNYYAIDTTVSTSNSKRVNDYRQKTFLLDSVKRSQLVF